MKVYLVSVYGDYIDDGIEELGIFSSKENAEKVVNDYNSKYGYGSYMAHLQEYELDKVYQD